MKRTPASAIVKKQCVMLFPLRSKTISSFLQVKAMKIFKSLAMRNIRIQTRTIALEEAEKKFGTGVS